MIIYYWRLWLFGITSMTNIYTRGHLHVHVVWQQLTVSLHNKKEVEKKTANLVWQAKSMTIIILFEKKLSA